MARRVPKLLCLIVLLSLGGCTSLAFTAANLPASFGDYERTAGIAYGPIVRQQLDVYVPGTDHDQARPVVVFIYGGGWTEGSRDRYRFVASALAERGLITVIPDYRLHPEGAFPVFVSDAALAVAWTIREISRYGGDPDRVFLMGHSAGAHIAALLALDRRHLEVAGSSSDVIRGMIGLSGAYDFQLTSAPLREVFGTVPDLRETQPVAFARGDAPPSLLLHGARDRIAAPRQSKSLAGRIEAAGGKVELIIYPDVNHSGTLAALASFRRSHAPVLDDVAGFIAGP